MTDRKRCISCERAIDAWAGICPFCNWNQAELPPSPDTVAPRISATQYKPPEDMNVRKMIGIAAGAVLSLVLAFAIGMVINRDGAPKRAPDPLEEQAAEHNTENLKPKRADTPLVPAGEGGIENEPITSAPALAGPGQVPDEYQRSDATAVSADEYAQMARRAQAEKKKKMATLVDPRALTGPAYAQGPRASTPGVSRTSTPGVSRTSTPGVSRASTPGVSRASGPEARTPPVRTAARAMRTRPVPEHQPLPRLSGSGTARFTLVVGADGRVKDVNVEQMLRGGNNAALISAIQTWRFKPATENGEPVAAPYSVEISFDRE
ncbi:MAG: energy transducer TonB [Thermoanaerobaculia bacterium]